jgi:hypothetical protein
VIQGGLVVSSDRPESAEFAGGRMGYESSDGSGLEMSLTASAELYWPDDR